MQISKRDELLVLAFLLREAEDFRYKERCEINVAGEYLHALQAELAKIDKKANFIIIQSITNLGCTERELRVTPVEWGYSGVVYCYLPPSPVPRGRINVEWREKE
jgi:hypothetical protein